MDWSKFQSDKEHHKIVLYFDFDSISKIVIGNTVSGAAIGEKLYLQIVQNRINYQVKFYYTYTDTKRTELPHIPYPKNCDAKGKTWIFRLSF